MLMQEMIQKGDRDRQPDQTNIRGEEMTEVMCIIQTVMLTLVNQDKAIDIGEVITEVKVNSMNDEIIEI